MPLINSQTVIKYIYSDCKNIKFVEQQNIRIQPCPFICSTTLIIRILVFTINHTENRIWVFNSKSPDE